MQRSDLAFTTIREQAQLLARREVSPVELVTAALARVERLEPRLNAWITLIPESALAEARRAEHEIKSGRSRGPLHGVPVGVKDLFWTRGVRTTAGSRILTDFVPDQDSAAVERLRAAGAIILGKTNMVEFAYGPTDYYHAELGPTRNPWDLDRFPGGSSSGSGAAVAAGEVPAALGSDTGGSIRNPASFCGISGLKPTYGRVSVFGAVPLSATLDHVGPLARTAEDCAIVLQAIAGQDARDNNSSARAVPDYLAELGSGIRGLRLGLPRDFFWYELGPGIGDAVEAAAEVLGSHGVTIIPTDLPGLAEDSLATMTVLGAEASAYHRRNILDRPDEYVPDIRQKLQDGLEIRAVDLVDAIASMRRLRATFRQAFTEVDALLTPTRDTVAPRQSAEGFGLDRFPHQVAGRAAPTLPFNAAGLPAISIPCGFDPRGLPIGLTLAGNLHQDALVLRLAHTYQQATDWHLRRPTAID